MSLTLRSGSFGISHPFPPHSSRDLGPKDPAGEPDVGFHSLLPLQPSPIGPCNRSPRVCILSSSGCASSVHREWAGRLSGCLGDFVGSSPSLSSPLGPLYPGLPQSSLPIGTPQFSLLQELSTAVIRVHCGSLRSLSLLKKVRRYACPLSLSLGPLSPSAGTPCSHLSGPHRDCLNP